MWVSEDGLGGKAGGGDIHILVRLLCKGILSQKLLNQIVEKASSSLN